MSHGEGGAKSMTMTRWATQTKAQSTMLSNSASMAGCPAQQHASVVLLGIAFYAMCKKFMPKHLKSWKFLWPPFWLHRHLEKLMFPLENSNSHLKMRLVFHSGALHFQVPEE